MPRRVPKRLLRGLLLAISAGLLTTIDVSWSLAFRGISNIPTTGCYTRESDGAFTPRRWMNPFGEHDTLDIEVDRSTGAVRIATRAYGPEYMGPIGIPMSSAENYEPAPHPIDMIPAWAQRTSLPWLHDVPWPKGTNSDWRTLDARGWPFPSFYSVSFVTSRWTHDSRGAITVPGQPTRSVGGSPWLRDPVTLPCLPIWSSLALNTLFFAALWTLLIYTLTTFKSRLARRKGRCPKCGYDLAATSASLPCPECGKPQTP